MGSELPNLSNGARIAIMLTKRAIQRCFSAVLALFLAGAAMALADVRPVARPVELPHARWDHRAESTLWTRSTISALSTHGKTLVRVVPRDIDAWCPAYSRADDVGRRAFWVGFLSALAKYESTWEPQAVGGGGQWYGLLQILPATARGYGCGVGTGAGLQRGSANLSCAVRIMAVTVPRDGVIAGHDGRWRGVAADWGPMRSAQKRSKMAAWLKKQSYCRSQATVRPRARPIRSR